MKVLLDTHVLLWASTYPAGPLSAFAADTIAEPQNEILVSAATAWELATKVRLGKLPEAVALEGRLLEHIDEAGYTMLPIHGALALRAGRLTGNHRDPFDRMIAAQALDLDIPVISKDANLDAFGIRRIW